MTTTTQSGIDGASTIVRDYFAEPIQTLQSWVDVLTEQLLEARASGPLTRNRLDAIVEPHAQRTLDVKTVPVYGAGFIAAIDLLSDARSHLAWWQGEDHRQLILASQSVNKELIDYSELEWYRVPMGSGKPHVAGPYVDYLCSDEYTITIAVPVRSEDSYAGVAGLDLLIDAVERDLTPRLRALGGEVTLVNGVGRVVISTDAHWATGDSVKGSRLAELPRAVCEGVALDVIFDAHGSATKVAS